MCSGRTNPHALSFLSVNPTAHNESPRLVTDIVRRAPNDISRDRLLKPRSDELLKALGDTGADDLVRRLRRPAHGYRGQRTANGDALRVRTLHDLANL
jgi:hypothetical protein